MVRPDTIAELLEFILEWSIVPQWDRAFGALIGTLGGRVGGFLSGRAQCTGAVCYLARYRLRNQARVPALPRPPKRSIPRQAS
jgi:hypothetical protein